MKNPMKFSTNRTGKITAGLVVVAVMLLLPGAMALNVIMQGYNLSRTGANTSETILTPANVATSFGLLFTNAVDGEIYAEPLYVQNLRIAGGIHNVIFVCTESNSVYAFDADTPGVIYWHDELGTPFTPSCTDLIPVVGITGTPVIDLKSGTMYLDTKLESGPSHELHALNITNGAEKFDGPVTVSPTGFSASIEHQRPGLLLLNGVVYLGYGSHCDDGAYHGYELGYNATNLSLLYTFNTTPSGSEGAIWSGGMAPAVDTNGNLYVMTGNGTYDGSANFGMSMIKLSTNLTVEDWATPTNYSTLSSEDLDLGSGGAVLLPGNYAVGMGKEPTLYLVDINNMGHVGNFVQTFNAVPNEGDTVGKSPVYWQGPTMQYLFVAHSNNRTLAYQFTNTSFNATSLGSATFSADDRVGGLSLSANGTTNGVLWEIGSDSNVRAYDAANFPKLLWTGNIGTYVKMTAPVVADGKVYVGTSTNLSVYGLTNYLYSQAAATNLFLSWAKGGTLLQSTNLLGKWVTTTTTSPYTAAPTNTQMFYRLSVP